MITAPRIYGIADRGVLAGRSVPDAVEAMAQAGIRWVQVRSKSGPDCQLWREVEESCRRVEGGATDLWVDDRVDVAATLPVRGVHLGQTDLSLEAARAVLPAGRWIGLSTHNLPQAREAEELGPEAIAVGPIFPTRSKADPDPTVGLGLLRGIRAVTRRPLLAIGGIAAQNFERVLEAGADCVVLLSALCGAENIETASRRFVMMAEESS